MTEHHDVVTIESDAGVDNLTGKLAPSAGTVCFGSDPASSVLDPDCKAHDLDNLYVVDSAFFPSIGAVNPTIIANALRVGQQLADRLS